MWVYKVGMRVLILLFCLLLGGVVHAQPAAPLDDGLARHLLNRLGYGPAPGEVAPMLAIGEGQPCLLLHRRTTSGGRVASVATMWHPGHLARFTGSV